MDAEPSGGSRIDVSRRITISAAKRLGRRIRHSGLSAADQSELELVLLDAFDGLTVISDILRSELPGVAFTPRLKTVGTIVDKLARERTMALPSMRDVAGIRIVEEMNGLEQDVLVRQIVEAVGGVVIDRRLRPSAGYRAVHIEVDCGGCFVEIQVRTRMQDQWAQIVERLGDTWGRQIRYGQAPANPGHVIAGEVTRADLWDLVSKVANEIDVLETAAAAIATEDVDPSDDRVLQLETNKRDLVELMLRLEEIVDSGGI